MGLEISDLPPPETVQGLWQSSAFGRRADQPPGAVRAGGFSMRTL